MAQFVGGKFARKNKPPANGEQYGEIWKRMAHKIAKPEKIFPYKN